MDDDLFAFAPVDGGNTFTSDTLPIDGGAEPLPFDDFSQDPLGLSSFGNSALLGSDPSIGSGFDVAYAVGDCKLGEVVQDVGSVAFAGACPAEFNLKGCGRTSAAVINCITPRKLSLLLMKYHSLLVAVDDRLPLLCSTANQKCCGGVSSAVVSRNNLSTMSLRVKKSTLQWRGIGARVYDADKPRL